MCTTVKEKWKEIKQEKQLKESGRSKEVGLVESSELGDLTLRGVMGRGRGGGGAVKQSSKCCPQTEP